MNDARTIRRRLLATLRCIAFSALLPGTGTGAGSGQLYAQAAPAPPAAIAKTPASPWEQAIQEFEAADRLHPPPRDGVLFVGSSSIRMWKLAESFPGLPVIPRGFGGSRIADSTEFAARIVLPAKPRVVILYAGDNDVAGGRTAAGVLDDFKAFVAAVHAGLPDARIVFISIKPSPARWALWPEMQKANALVRAHAEGLSFLRFLDVTALMLGADGQPRPELYVEDRLHMSPAGYRVWVDLVKLAVPELSRGGSAPR